VSKRNRILLALFCVFVGAIVWLVHGIVTDIEPRYREAAEEPLVDISRVLAAFVSGDIRDGVIDPARLRQAFATAYREQFHAQIYALDKTHVDLRVYVTDLEGTVLYDSLGRDEGKSFALWHDVRLTLQGGYGARTSLDDTSDIDSSVMFVGAPLIWNEQIVGMISVGKPTRNLTTFAEVTRGRIIAAGVTSVLALVVLGLAVATWMARPFGIVSDYLRLARNARAMPLPRLRRSAIGMLGAAYDEMRDALSGRNYVEEYVQSLTHELKSPLSAIRGAAELMTEEMPAATRAKFLQNIRTESDRIQDIVDRLLELAALEKKRGLADVGAVDCQALLQEVRETCAAAAQRNQIKVQCECAPGLAIQGEHFLLHRALVNLLQNAIDFSNQAAAIELHATRSGGEIAIAIRDHGVGIPEFAAKRIWERFYSLPRADGRKGTGLGLSFVREIADLHRGTVTLENHPDGGVEAVLRLPLVR
jgi:two-component system sensor histidine kinase CreC